MFFGQKKENKTYLCSNINLAKELRIPYPLYVIFSTTKNANKNNTIEWNLSLPIQMSESAYPLLRQSSPHADNSWRTNYKFYP